MTDSRLPDYVQHIRHAAKDALVFVDGMDKAAFLDDRRTQQAVILSLIIIGEAATRIMDRDPTFAEGHPDVPWHAMKGMRNRLAHGYFDINLDVVWETIQTAIPDLLDRLPDSADQTAPH